MAAPDKIVIELTMEELSFTSLALDHLARIDGDRLNPLFNKMQQLWDDLYRSMNTLPHRVKEIRKETF